ncbi:MAG: hypothetical protein IPO17_16670 [Flavobacteriales bacterium]|nr:hypothetical protein [Flavobacteriales bacterium]
MVTDSLDDAPRSLQSVLKPQHAYELLLERRLSASYATYHMLVFLTDENGAILQVFERFDKNSRGAHKKIM